MTEIIPVVCVMKHGQELMLSFLEGCVKRIVLVHVQTAEDVLKAVRPIIYFLGDRLLEWHDFWA